VKRFLLLAFLVAVPAAARADGVVNDCKPNVDDGVGCGCNHEPFHICDRPDMQPPVQFDLSRPLDLSPGLDGGLDAQREHRRRRNASNGRGLIFLSGASVLVLAALRRRYRTRRPTPAESALAASATRSDS
jgi:hypothetical protein